VRVLVFREIHNLNKPLPVCHISDDETLLREPIERAARSLERAARIHVEVNAGRAIL
jgi:hypothetical protein